jgi:EAL and modified HD-GYP domain-containing signal transduction protein
VIEILETSPDHHLLSAVKRLQTLGFRLALDDFTMSPEWNVFIPCINVIKFDVQKILQKKLISILTGTANFYAIPYCWRRKSKV